MQEESSIPEEIAKKTASLHAQITYLKQHFESEIKSCKDPGLLSLYGASAKTLAEMEDKLHSIEFGQSFIASTEDWQENAYRFLV